MFDAANPAVKPLNTIGYFEEIELIFKVRIIDILCISEIWLQ